MINKDAIKINKIFSVIFFVLLCFFFLYILTDVMKAKESSYKNRDFFSEKNDIDVMFFGSSHIENFFSPMDLWSDYGITAYNFGNPEEPIPISYCLIRNVVNYKKPKLIILDTSMFNSRQEYTYESSIHYALDSFPVSKEKIDTVNDIYNDVNKRMDMFFLLSPYHSRWKNIGNEHVEDINYFVKGSLSYGHPYTMQVESFEPSEYIDDKAVITDNNIDLIYLNRIIDYCKEKDVKLLFVCTPYVLSSNEIKNQNYIEQFAKDRRIPFINYAKMNSVTDMHVDMYNIGHVNQSGLHKMTKHLGSYLFKNYDLIDHREDITYGNYWKCYDNYKKLKIESIMSVDSLENTLMLLHDKDIVSYVYFRNMENILNILPITYDLVQNINRDNLTIYDIGMNSANILPLKEINKISEEEYLLVSNTKNGFSEIIGNEAIKCISDVLCKNNIYDIEKYYDSDILIMILDNETQAIKLVKSFAYTDDTVQSEILYDNVDKGYIYK